MDMCEANNQSGLIRQDHCQDKSIRRICSTNKSCLVLEYMLDTFTMTTFLVHIDDKNS